MKKSSLSVFSTYRMQGLLMAACLVLAMEKIAGQQPTLTVKLQNISSHKGKVMLALFQQADGFPFVHQKAYKLQQLPAREGEILVAFSQLPAGKYALAVYHDENGDSKLNTNALGIPKEGYGFSKNVRPKFSAPKFDEAAFDLAVSSQMTIQVRY